MRRNLLGASVIVAACSGSSSRATVPVSPPPPPSVVTAPIVPDTTPTLPPILVANDAPGFTFRDPERRKKLEAAFPAIEKMIGEEMKRQALPGLAFGIVIDGELAYTKGFGLTGRDATTAPDADTVYRIGSITKSFTGLALLALRDEGALQLDDPLAKWIPEASQLVYPTRDARPITLRQLANHTSGLPPMGLFEPETGPTEDVVVKSLAKLALESTPGTRWSYSNLAFGLLGIVITHAAKAPYHDIVASRIWKPLGMTATAWSLDRVPPDRLAPAFQIGPTGPTINDKSARLGAIDGAGGIYSSVRDMAKYVAFQLAAYPPRSGDDPGAIRRATVREAHATGVAVAVKHERPATALSYGYGFGREQSCRLDDVVGHDGGIESYRAEIRFSPSRGVGVVALTNFGTGNPLPLADRAIAELDKTGALVPRATPASPVLAEAMKRLLAIYHQWDEAAFKTILARPIDPREQAELATYLQLHGKCTDVTLAETESPIAGVFDLTCERGAFSMRLSTNAQGLIDGFVGVTRGLEPPPGFARIARAVIALQDRWDDKVFAKHLAKGPATAPQLKARAAELRARHGACTIKGPIHEGFDWGFELACTKEHVEIYLTPSPTEPTQIVGMRLQPVRGAPKRCD